MLDLTFKIRDKVFPSPIIMASGCSGYADEYSPYCDLSKITVVTKGITLEPRKGNTDQRIREVKNGMINRIGLENIGIHKFVETKLSVLKEKNINFIVNVAGSTIQDYIEISKVCEINNIDCIELNLSCPNVKEGCIEFGTCPETLYKLVSEVRNVFNGIIIVKLTPNTSTPTTLAIKAEQAGADAISAINTVKGLSVNLSKKDNKIISKIVKGGLSGACIKHVALNYVYEISKVVNIPIIAIGGISCIEDVIEFYAVGSSAIEIGTVNFTHPSITNELYSDLKYFMNHNNFKNLEELKDAFQ
jgi:dihydroorotate dehydrogenase (NAD+) catalytic subunit